MVKRDYNRPHSNFALLDRREAYFLVYYQALAQHVSYPRSSHWDPGARALSKEGVDHEEKTRAGPTSHQELRNQAPPEPGPCLPGRLYRICRLRHTAGLARLLYRLRRLRHPTGQPGLLTSYRKKGTFCSGRRTRGRAFPDAPRPTAAEPRARGFPPGGGS